MYASTRIIHMNTLSAAIKSTENPSMRYLTLIFLIKIVRRIKLHKNVYKFQDSKLTSSEFINNYGNAKKSGIYLLI